MTQISKDSFDYLNQLRQNPTIAIPKITEQLQYFKGNELHLPGQITLITNEGTKAWQECIDFLEKQQALEPMTWSDNLAKAASDHVQDTGSEGKTGHVGTDGSSVDQRISRYGEWLSTIGENISYGQKTGEDVIIQLIIDDGVANRGHRTNCFNPDFKTVGISDGYHKTYKTMCVFDLAGGMSEKGEEGDDNFQQASNAQQFKELLAKNSNLDKDDLEKQFQQLKIQQGDQNPNQTTANQQFPPGCISCNTQKTICIKNGQKTTTITKTFKFKDGSTQQSVETITEG